jgi:hypothetical protein
MNIRDWIRGLGPRLEVMAEAMDYDHIQECHARVSRLEARIRSLEEATRIGTATGANPR